MLRRVLLWLIALGVAWVFLAAVWPTRYRYAHVVTDGDDYPVRIDRFTGDADMLTPDDGWVPMGPGDDSGGTTDDHTS